MQEEQPKDKAGNILCIGDKLVPINVKPPGTRDSDQYAGTAFEIIEIDPEMRTVTIKLPIIRARFKPLVGTVPDPMTETEYHTRAMTYDSILSCGRVKEGTPSESIPKGEDEIEVKLVELGLPEPDYLVLSCICGNRFSHLTHLSKAHCPDCGREDPVDGGNNYFRIIST